MSVLKSSVECHEMDQMTSVLKSSVECHELDQMMSVLKSLVECHEQGDFQEVYIVHVPRVDSTLTKSIFNCV